MPAQGYILPPQAKPEPTKRIITFSSITGDEHYVQLEWPDGHQEIQRPEGEDLAAYQAELYPTPINALIQRQHEKNSLLIERQQEGTRKEIEGAREVNRKLLEGVYENL